MPELTLAVDLSDKTARVAVVDESGQVLARAEAPPAAGAVVNGVREAVRRALAAAGGTVNRIGVAMPAPGEQVPPDIITALREVSSRQTEIHPVAAGTAAVLAEQWLGAARGLKQVIAF